MHGYNYRSKNFNYGYKMFSLNSAGFSSPHFSYPGYPSYLGVNVFRIDEKDMPLHVLGFTNGKAIALSRNLKGLLLEFVQFHEEEHVKDMFATEKEVDRRALQRLLARHPAVDKTELKAVKRLLRRRWHSLSGFENGKNFFYKTRKEEKKKSFEIMKSDWLYGDGYF